MEKCASKERSVPTEELMPIFREQLDAGKNVWFSPRGISMLPMLRQGVDSVMLSPVAGTLTKYDLPLYRRDDGKYILHRIVKVGKTYTCIGDNQFDLEQGIRQDQLIAVVTAFTRGKKFHSVKDLDYQIYCRVWHYSRGIRHLLRWSKRYLHMWRITRLFRSGYKKMKFW